MVLIWQPQKEKLPVLGARHVVVTWYRDTNLRMRQLPCQYAYGQTIIVPICRRYIDQPIAPIRLLSRPNQPIVPMCLRSTDRPIDKLYIQPLSPPDARTVLLPESDNCRTYTPAIQRPSDRSSSECSTYYHYLMLAPHCH